MPAASGKLAFQRQALKVRRFGLLRDRHYLEFRRAICLHHLHQAVQTGTLIACWCLSANAVGEGNHFVEFGAASGRYRKQMQHATSIFQGQRVVNEPWYQRLKLLPGFGRQRVGIHVCTPR